MFKQFKKVIQNKLDFLTENSVALFQVEIDKEMFWNLYLDSFPPGTNEIYRENRQYDCNCCKAFINHYGSIVGIIDGELISIWDIETEEPFQIVSNKLSAEIKKLKISDVFYTDNIYGKDSNFDANRVDHPKYDHLYYKFPDSLIVSSVAAKQGAIKQTKEVIIRGFEELNPSSVETVLELIDEKSLYRGEEHKATLENFKIHQRGFIFSKNKDNYSWEIAVKNGRTAAIRNTAIGTLLINLSSGMDLELAVKKYESVVAPSNYKRPKAIFTKSMREAAEKKATDLGLMDSLARRYSKLEDISIQNVLWASGESKKVMKSPFDLLANDDKVGTKKFDHIEEIGIGHFLESVLPSAETVELMLDNSYNNNLVSLIAPENPEAPSLFKWNNGFSWAYNGDFTDSIKDAVKAMGGNVDGVLRFSLSWAEGDSSDNSDLDAHCKLPGGHIYFQQKNDFNSGGMLDVDITNPTNQGNKNIVENITWANKSKMPKGDYTFSVHNYALRGSQKGFTAEIEFDGQIHSFVYDKPLRNNENVFVSTVHFDGTSFKIKKSLPSTHASKEVWGVSTMKFVPVTTIMYSPNHWDGQTIGNKHYFFMLENCINNGTPRGFFNEFLRNDLTEHKRVFEALGAKMKVEHTDNQLSGVGVFFHYEKFSSIKNKF